MFRRTKDAVSRKREQKNRRTERRLRLESVENRCFLSAVAPVAIAALTAPAGVSHAPALIAMPLPGSPAGQTTVTAVQSASVNVATGGSSRSTRRSMPAPRS